MKEKELKCNLTVELTLQFSENVRGRTHRTQSWVYTRVHLEKYIIWEILAK